MKVQANNKVILKPIDESNYEDALDLQVEENQKNFVASNVYSLAQAFIYKYAARPYGIYIKKSKIDVLREEGAKEIKLSYEPENTVADSLYVSLGFKPTGEIDDGEIVMSLNLSS